MRRSAATGLILGLVVFACTSSPKEQPPDSPIPSSTSSEPPPAIPAPDIQFLLRDTYSVGDRIPIRIENVGAVAYRYQSLYQACFLSYFDSDGREFVIPPGTHCDILSEALIRPGETVRLFVWELDECIKDNWGCSKARPLDPGTYAIHGAFRPIGKGPVVRVRVSFVIKPGY